MSPPALILAHDPAPERHDRLAGAVIPALRACGIGHVVYSFVPASHDVPDTDHQLVVVLGSHRSVYDTGVEWIAPEAGFVEKTIAARVPVLGICFGAQLLAHVLGGSVAPTSHPEQGFTSIDSDDPLLVPAGPWMQMHNDCFTVPPQGRELARNRSGSQAFTAGPNLGVQFHPEITADCFDSWIERWDIATERPSALTGSRALETLRREVAAREKNNIELCHRLIHTFVKRCCSFR